MRSTCKSLEEKIYQNLINNLDRPYGLVRCITYCKIMRFITCLNIIHIVSYLLNHYVYTELTMVNVSSVFHDLDNEHKTNATGRLAILTPPRHLIPTPM